MTLTTPSSDVSHPDSIRINAVDSNAAGKLFPLDKEAAQAGATIVRSANSVSYVFPHAVRNPADEAIISGACDDFVAKLQMALLDTDAKISREKESARAFKQ